MGKADGEQCLPKLPSQLREYDIRWERNSRVQKAFLGIKSDGELLELLIRKQLPLIWVNAASGLANTAASWQPVESAGIAFPEPQRPPRTTPLIAAAMRRSEDAGPLIVGTDLLGRSLPSSVV